MDKSERIFRTLVWIGIYLSGAFVIYAMLRAAGLFS
jgi:hypothetical protein